MTLSIIHTFLLILTIIFSFFWTNNPGMSNFTLQLVGLLAVIFFFHDLINRKISPNNPIQKYRNLSNSVILTLLTLLLVLSTAGLTSPLFFGLHFLVFSLSLFFYPFLGFSFNLALILAFLLNNDLTSTQAITTLIPLLLIPPFARFFGTQYLRLLEDKQQIKILKYQADHLKRKTKQEDASTLLWLSIEFRHKLDHALDLVSQISSGLSNIPYHQKDLLKALYSDLKELFNSGQTLQKQIDKLTDVDKDSDPDL